MKTPNKIRKAIVSLLLTFLTSQVSLLAGAGSSGGGNAVVCFESVEAIRSLLNEQLDQSNQIPKNQGQQIHKLKNFKQIPQSYHPLVIFLESYDLYKTRKVDIDFLDKDTISKLNQISHIQPILSDENECEEDYIERNVERFSSLYPKIKARYFSGQNILEIHEGSIVEGPITQINDILGDIVKIPQNCMISTIVNQVPLENSTDKRQIIYDALLYHHFEQLEDSQLELHSKLSKSTFNLHEYLMASLYEDGLRSSNQIHKLVELIITSEPYSIAHFESEITKAGLASYFDVDSLSGIPLDLKNILNEVKRSDLDTLLTGSLSERPLNLSHANFQLISLVAKNITNSSLRRKIKKVSSAKDLYQCEAPITYGRFGRRKFKMNAEECEVVKSVYAKFLKEKALENLNKSVELPYYYENASIYSENNIIEIKNNIQKLIESDISNLDEAIDAQIKAVKENTFFNKRVK